MKTIAVQRSCDSRHINAVSLDGEELPNFDNNVPIVLVKGKFVEGYDED